MSARVAIDDFGTGYTSIAQLRALPVDELKIDGSFIRRLPETSDRVLLQIVEDLAEHLHLFTVAEGVETAAQVEELAAVGCDALQGYYFSRPLDPTAMERWAADRAPSPTPGVDGSPTARTPGAPEEGTSALLPSRPGGSSRP